MNEVESGDSFLLLSSIASMQEFVKMQNDIIRETRRKIALKPQKKIELTFSSQEIVNFEPIDPEFQKSLLTKRMVRVARKLKQIKEEKEKRKSAIADAIAAMIRENDVLKEQISRLTK